MVLFLALRLPSALRNEILGMQSIVHTILHRIKKKEIFHRKEQSTIKNENG